MGHKAPLIDFHHPHCILMGGYQTTQCHLSYQFSTIHLKKYNYLVRVRVSAGSTVSHLQ